MANDDAANEWAALANVISSQNQTNEDFHSALDFSVKQPLEEPRPCSSVFPVINPAVNGG